MTWLFFGKKQCRASAQSGGFVGVRFSLFRAFVSSKKERRFKIKFKFKFKSKNKFGFLFERNSRRPMPEKGKPAPAAEANRVILFLSKKQNHTRLPTHLFTGGPRGEKAFEFPTNQPPLVF
ncbi:MAG: hypothetical protein D6714_07540 [Bacteroidetes bacterium]|nr:MAG: hypothetical protein D6714_07540 [Bacteroidota bacterium]